MGAPVPGLAVVRLPIASRAGAVVGYELLFARAGEPPAPAANARATAAMLDGAFADIGLDRLTGRHPAWLSITRDFLLEVGTPPLRPDRAVIQIPAQPADDDLLAVLQRLTRAGYTLAVSGYDGVTDLGALLDLCSIVKLSLGDSDEEVTARLVADLARVGADVVATGVDDEEALDRCRRLGIPLYQGAVLAQPRTVLGPRVATANAASLRTLADLSAADLAFEEIEAIVASDVGLSLKLLRYVNSAFFALPRTVGSVREALALLGSRTVQRWAMVVVMAQAPDTPAELVTLALQRARMCETLATGAAPDERATLFTVGLFSVADALLGMPMEQVLDELPFSEDVRRALLCHEGRHGRVLEDVLAYERGEFPHIDGRSGADDGSRLAQAYRDAIGWADDATGAVCGDAGR